MLGSSILKLLPVLFAFYLASQIEQSFGSLPYQAIYSQLSPPALMYNRTGRLIFMMGPPACPRDKFRLVQINRTGHLIEWSNESPFTVWTNDSTFVLLRAAFREWGNYSASCFTVPTFTYQPATLSVPVPVNPRIFLTNFTRLEDEYFPPPPDESENSTYEVPSLDEFAPTTFEFPVPLGQMMSTWLLKFDVGNGFYPNDEVGNFTIAGLDNLASLTNSLNPNLQSRLTGVNLQRLPYIVPYEGFPNGTTYRFTFDLSAEKAAIKMPSICDIPVVATVAMKSNIEASKHTVNATLKFKYQAQQITASARLEGNSCVMRCSIKSACPLLETLKLQIVAGNKQIPAVSSERSTSVEIKILPEDCDSIIGLAKNNTGTLVCSAKNEVANVELALPLAEVPGIRNLERELEKIATDPLPMWAKITIPVACIVALVLFIVVIILCCQKCKNGNKKGKQSPSANTTSSTVVITTTAGSNTNTMTADRSTEYRGPVSTRGQTYQMPQQESVTDEFDHHPEPVAHRAQPTIHGSWEGSFDLESSSNNVRRPVEAAPMVRTLPATAPVPRLGGGPPVGVYNRPPVAMANEPAPPTTIITLPPTSRNGAQPFSYAQPKPPLAYSYTGDQNANYEPDQSYAMANRQAAVRYLPTGSSTTGSVVQGSSTQGSPAMARRPPPTTSGNKSQNPSFV